MSVVAESQERAVQTGRLRAHRKDVALGAVAVYTVVGIYIVANGMTTGYVARVSSVNREISA